MGSQGVYNVLQVLVEYKIVFLFLMATVLFLILGILCYNLYIYLKTSMENSHDESDKEYLRTLDYSKLNAEKKANVIRRMIAPDGVDPNPLGYMVINDKGKDIFIRTFTIEKLPKRTTFANTFADLLDYPDCTSSIYITPISESKMIRKFDKHINVLEAEWIHAAGDTNRQRKLNSQFSETEGWAQAVECGENSFYNVGFLFSIHAESLEGLNKLSDDFRGKALNKSIDVSSCFGVQAEAYLSNAPLCKIYTSLDGGLGFSSAVKMHQMDKYSASTIYNYTQSDFSHKDGVPIGRNLVTHRPVVFDLFDSSHDGYTAIICGKTGTGKSLTIKALCSRYALHGYRFVAIDSQARRGTSEGEYAGIAELLPNGANFMIRSDSPNIMNIFEVEESLKFVRDSASTGHEVRTLELNEKIAQVVNTLLTMVQGEQKIKDFQMGAFINRVLVDNVTKVYNDFGIYDRKPDSLYEMGEYIKDGKMTSGKIKKKLPTISDFYKVLLQAQSRNTDETYDSAFKVIVAALRDYVKELYYSDKTLKFFSAEEFEKLPLKDANDSTRRWENPKGDIEDVYAIRGVRAYYDGQSTISINKDCTFANIDISQLPESEKVLARQIGIDFINENFIKKNSESLKAADKLVAIFDEAHENFAYEYCLRTIDNIVRTARKRNTSIILSTQSVKEFDNHAETQSILRNTAVKFVFKQDYQDRDYLIRALGITESQVDMILELGGDPDEDSDRNARRGEVCIIDNKRVCFCKVDYLKSVEALACETSAEALEQLFKVS